MRLAFHGATTMTCDLQTDVSVTARAGYAALEIWTAKVDRYLADHSLSDLRDLFGEHDVFPQALNSIEFIGFRGQEYVLVQQRLHELGHIAQAIGCPTVVIVPSPLPDRRLAWADVRSEYVSVLRDLGGIAAAYDVRLSFEFLGFGWCSVRTPRGAYEIVRACGCDNVGVTIDAAHLYGGGGLLAELDDLDPRSIFAFHLDDMEDVPKEAVRDDRRLLPGLGILPLGDICERLQRIGYDGPCAVELFRPEYWSWGALELAVQARQAAVRVLSPYFEIA
jgi:2-keto-myo-inositol isomerase